MQINDRIDGVYPNYVGSAQSHGKSRVNTASEYAANRRTDVPRTDGRVFSPQLNEWGEGMQNGETLHVAPTPAEEDMGGIQNFVQQSSDLTKMNADQIYSYVQTAAMRDPLVQEKIFNKVMVDAANRFREQSRYQKIFIKQSITPDQQTALNKSFYMFNLDYSTAVDTHPHAFARAHRTLSFHLMMFSMRINQGGAMSVAPDGSQAVLKDVGGNPMMHFNATRHNVHTCYPLLDDNDAARQGRFFGTLAQMTEPFDKTQRLMRSRYLARDPRLLCSSKAQFCAVKSPNIMFLHSTYNMTLDDIGRIMDSAGAVSAMGCFIFHPDTLYKQSGYIKDQECHFEKYKRKKVLYIRFFFRNDSQNGYEHRFDTYVALVKAFRVPSRVTDRVYVTQTPYHLNSVLFFELTRTDCAFLPKNRQFRMMPAMAEDHYILYYWKWETLAQRFAAFGLG